MIIQCCSYLYSVGGLQMTKDGINKLEVFVQSLLFHYYVSIITPFAWLYVRVGKLLTCGKHVHDGIISLRGEVLAPKTKSIPPLFIEVSVQSQNVSSHEFACLGYIFYHFLRFLIIWFWNRSDSVVFHFHCIIAYLLNFYIFTWDGVCLITSMNNINISL